MADYIIRTIRAKDSEWIRRFICDHWGAEMVFVHGTRFHPHELPGFIAEIGTELAGLLTYSIIGGNCEIVTLDSLFPGKGVGRALIEAVRDAAKDSGCRRLFVVTTNDNLHALRFYQRKGFTLAALRPNALEETRKLKPIPRIGMNGIPIRDELELEMTLD